MTLILSGTDGLSDVDGSAATPAIRGTDANTGIFFPAADTIAFSEGGVESMRIDASGRLGIGETSPTNTLDVKAALGRIKLTSSTGTNNALVLFNNTSGNAYVGLDSSAGSLTAAYALNLYHEGAYPITFTNNNTERMRITSGGELLVGLTSQTGTASVLAVSSTKNNGNAARIGLLSLGGAANGSDYPQIGYNTAFTATTTINYIGNDTASWIRFSAGKVETFTAVSGTAGNAISPTTGPFVAQSGISWTNGSSDVRQKKNFEPTQGLAEILQIEPIKYHFNWEDDTAPKKMGFKAQNLLPLIPEMVVEKDEKAEDGSPYLTITPDYMLPVLVKAIQELKALADTQASTITALQADVVALKGTP